MKNYKKQERQEKNKKTKYYSIADITKELNLPESTVRYYRDRFKNYVPATKKGGRY